MKKIKLKQDLQELKTAMSRMKVELEKIPQSLELQERSKKILAQIKDLEEKLDYERN